MGWDAFSSAEMTSDYQAIEDPILRNEFKEAAEYVGLLTGCVDWFLRKGGLDCGDDMLIKATGCSVYVDYWSSKTVKMHNKNANWDFEYKDSDAWIYWSARKFLQLCAENDLSIKFSW